MPKVPKEDIYDQVFEATQPFDESYYKEGDKTHFVDFVDWAVENEVFPPMRDRRDINGKLPHEYPSHDNEPLIPFLWKLFMTAFLLIVGIAGMVRFEGGIGLLALSSVLTGFVWVIGK